jgi:mannose-1-phosphate guanylyltransferase
VSSTKGVWAVVLAAGEGRRLAAHTTNATGLSVPKQYCSFGRARCMLRWAIDRARRVVAPDQVVTVVAKEHRGFWEHELADLPRENVVVQPRNKGTAAGIRLPLVEILSRDPDATVVVFPSDHYIADEETLTAAIENAIVAVEWDPVRAVLLGITPDAPETEYGWILPTHAGWPLSSVERFVEKPNETVAAELLLRGALWNSFLFVAKARTLVALFEQALPGLAHAFEECAAAPNETALARLYTEIPTNDFSHEVLERTVDRLRVLAVPACGWSDLGTPPRLARFLGMARKPDRERRLEKSMSSVPRQTVVHF